MTLVSDDPSLWPYVNAFRLISYFIVASVVAVIYDFVLSFGQEVDLIWNQRWSIVTFLYLSVRYVGIPYSVISILSSLSTFLVTDAGCIIMSSVVNWASFVVNAMLGVIMITRLHAMYQQSKRVLIFLVVTFLAVTIACAVMTGILDKNILGEELVLSGSYQCNFDYQGNAQILIPKTWILGTVWEVIALCLAAWVAVKHFRQQPPTGSIMGDCFAVLMKTHMLYFASFVASACFHLGYFTLGMQNSLSVGGQVYSGMLTFFGLVQLFVLGPRLILSVRELNARLLDDYDEGGTGPTIDFQMHVRTSTGDGV